MNLTIFLTLLFLTCHVEANVKAVFAHFMVGNTAIYTVADWENEIRLAQAAKIDGFVMNMAKDEPTSGPQLNDSFTAAANLGSSFKLLFSFDYAGNGLWEADKVIALIQKYGSHSAYYRRGAQPLVSTFEGPKAAPDWPRIKQATNCFFMPSWSSLGAKPAWALGHADGLFSWAAWPTGAKNMDTFTDASYLDELNGKPYMMGVSPWFYTNMPGFRKNWLWRGDSLWFDRWINVLFLQPEYVQIITWNDFGESHHIGPLNDKGYEAFTRGKTLYNYALGKDHSGWRDFLPFLIDMAKTNTTVLNNENVVGWYRLHPHTACGTGGTTGNTASQLQEVFPPGDIVEDRVFFAALLGSTATVSVSIGGVASAATWTHVPGKGVGLYRGSVGFNGRQGAVTITISRGGDILTASGSAITSTCTSGTQNYNPIVIRGQGRSISPVSPISLSDAGCTAGFGDKKYGVLCSFSCKYDYCPRGACTCTNIGEKNVLPKSKDLSACPAPGKDTTYLGLCSFACNYGACPDSCKIVPDKTICSAPLPTAPPIPVCIKGMGTDKHALMCTMACARGFCPPEICSCVEAGVASQLVSSVIIPNIVGTSKIGEDYDLCKFTCPRGICPSNACNCSGSGCTGGGGTGSLPGLVLFEKRKFSSATVGMTEKTIGGQQTDKCKLAHCLNQDTHSANCGNDQKALGFAYDEDCATGEAKAVCCPSNSGFTKEDCHWRAGIFDELESYCEGSCFEGETRGPRSIFGDTYNGICLGGAKTFCCKSPQTKKATEGCEWTKCGQRGCPEGKERKETKVQICDSGYTPWPEQSDYCCPIKGAIETCDWIGTGPNCGDTACQSTDILILKDNTGAYKPKEGMLHRCAYGQGEKSLCCKVNAPKTANPIEADCSTVDMCQAFEGSCDDDESEEPTRKRNVFDIDTAQPPHYHGHSHGHSRHHRLRQLEEALLSKNSVAGILDERGSGEKFLSFRWDTKAILRIRAPNYLAGPAAEEAQVARLEVDANLPPLYFYQLPRTCGDTGIIRGEISATHRTTTPFEGEHLFEVQVLGAFGMFTIHNTFDGNRNIVGVGFVNDPLTMDFWKNIFQEEMNPTDPNAFPDIGGVRVKVPIQRLLQLCGSITNPDVMALLPKPPNGLKGRIINSVTPFDLKKLKRKVVASLKGGELGDVTEWLNAIAMVPSVFDYVNDPWASATFLGIIIAIRQELVEIQDYLDSQPGSSRRVHLAERWDEFITLYLEESARSSQQWLDDAVAMSLEELRRDGAATNQVASLIAAVERIGRRKIDMRWPGYDVGKGKGKGKEKDP